MGDNDPRFMLSLARGLAVLQAFEHHAALSVSDIVKRTGFSRSSVVRCLFTLDQLGHVRAAGSLFHLQPSLLPLARAYVRSDPLALAAQPVLDAIRDRIGESSSIAVLDPGDRESILYICRAEAARIISIPLQAGARLPSRTTSMGRVLLAALQGAHLDGDDELSATLAVVGADGYALVDEELAPGLRSIAVPVRDRDGATRGAMNVAAATNRRTSEWLIETALPELRAAAVHLSRVI